MGSFWDMPEAARRPIIKLAEEYGLHLGPDSVISNGLVYNENEGFSRSRAVDTVQMKVVSRPPSGIAPRLGDVVDGQKVTGSTNIGFGQLGNTVTTELESGNKYRTPPLMESGGKGDQLMDRGALIAQPGPSFLKPRPRKRRDAPDAGDRPRRK